MRELPDLILSPEDWEEIGLRMGWLRTPRLTDKASDALAGCEALLP